MSVLVCVHNHSHIQLQITLAGGQHHTHMQLNKKSLTIQNVLHRPVIMYKKNDYGHILSFLQCPQTKCFICIHRPIIVYTTANNIDKVEKKYISCPFYSSSVFKSVTEQLLASLNLLLARYCLSYQSFLLPPTKALCCYTCQTQILVKSIIKERSSFSIIKQSPQGTSLCYVTDLIDLCNLL